MDFIVAVDPGLKSGLAVWQDGEFAGSWILDVFDLEDLMFSYATSYGDSLTIVCEKFIINARTAKVTQAPWSLEIIGCLRYISQKFCSKNMVMYSPAEAKGFSTNEKLKTLGWYHKGTAGHDNDASRHLLLHVVKNRIMTEEQIRTLL